MNTPPMTPPMTPPPYQLMQPPPIQQAQQAQQYQGPPIPIDLGYEVGSPGGLAEGMEGALLGPSPIQCELFSKK